MNSTTRRIDECSDADRQRFFELMQFEFDGVTFENFIKDFEEKQYVMILTDNLGKIVGFSTLMEIELMFKGKNIILIFSGDTTVLCEYRTSFGFGIELSKFFVRAIDLYPHNDIYYVLISKGWRTYKVMPFYFKKFFPCFENEISESEKSLIDAFGYKKYPSNYVKEMGLVRFCGETERLKPECSDAAVPPRNDKHIDFFFKKNPEYLDGSELVCMAKVSFDNFTKVVPKMLLLSENKIKTV